jgi:hypothetical protein
MRQLKTLVIILNSYYLYEKLLQENKSINYFII